VSTRSLAVVTVTYNSASVLGDFLESLRQQDGIDLRLYVVDNGSTDATAALIRAAMPQLDIDWIPNAQNLGVAVGNNQGIIRALADGYDWVLLLNNDTMFRHGFLSDLIAVAEKHAAPILTPTIEATDPPETVWFFSGSISPMRGMRVRHLDMGEPMRRDLPVIFETPYASTCCLLVSRRVFEIVGLMDPTYFVYGDDVDFCLRARRAGFPYQVAGQLKLLHKASSLTGDYAGPFAARWISRNWVLVARRHCNRFELATGALYMLAYAFLRAASRRETARTLARRLRAYLEGWSLQLDSEPPKVPVVIRH
jgi:GT2 family glycosyltransferase